MKRKISAILAADIAGYSKLVAEDEEETVRRLGAYRSVFDDLIKRYDGRIFNTAGDSVLAEFPSSVDAVRCAIDVQESLRTRNMAYPASRQMEFRIGISVGDVIEREGDLLGDGVNIAARLEALAPPGGISISRSVYEQVANKLTVGFADIGQQTVKNLPNPVHVYIVTQDRKIAAVEPGAAGAPQPRRPLVLPVLIGAAAAMAVALTIGAIWTLLPASVAPTPRALVVSGATPSPEGAFKGAMHCDKLPFATGPLRTVASMTIKAGAITFSRVVTTPDGARKVGLETGVGNLDPNGGLQLKTSWSGQRDRLDGSYSGTLSAVGGRLTGRQIVEYEGVRHERTCTIDVMRDQ